MRGRPAIINQPEIKHNKHLDLLDAVEQKAVRYRWGIETGTPLSQRETAEAMGTTQETVKRIEHRAAQKIIDHLEELQDVSLEEEVADLRACVNELEDIVDANSINLVLLEMEVNALKNKRRWFGRRS